MLLSLSLPRKNKTTRRNCQCFFMYLTCRQGTPGEPGKASLPHSEASAPSFWLWRDHSSEAEYLFCRQEVPATFNFWYCYLKDLRGQILGKALSRDPEKPLLSKKQIIEGKTEKESEYQAASHALVESLGRDEANEANQSLWSNTWEREHHCNNRCSNFTKIKIK